MATLPDVRTALASAIAGAGYRVHTYPPPAVIPPAVVIVPGEPYLEIETIGRPGAGIIATVSFEVNIAVASIDNQGSLEQLEAVLIDVLAALPSGTTLDRVGRPLVETVGPSDLLTCRIDVAQRAVLT